MIKKGNISLPRNRIARGVGRKRMRAASKANCGSTEPLPPQPRCNEDSGLGDSSFDGEHSAEAAPLSRPGASFPVQSTGKQVTGVLFSSFGEGEKVFVGTDFDVGSKRLRLDLTEEANELPEQETSFAPRREATPKIVSFKNVPGLLLPTSALQVQPSSLLSHAARQVVQQKPFSPRVEHLMKPKLVSPPKASSKCEKAAKKKGKSHILEGNLPSKSSDGAYELKLLTQPEGQHRARYQTEGSRGAVKDRGGSGHPTVKLMGYEKATTLQVFVASDGGCVSPHLFYQTCKVSGKNSTPCKEDRIGGTTVLEICMHPDKDMTVSCDCVGILKERNVDVEQRVKAFVSRGKKKSTKCRLVFRTSVTLPSGAHQLLQVVSQPINCTQPPGIPEICRTSRSKCSVEGKEELFIIGKNFYKDTEVVFVEVEPQGDKVLWSQMVLPEKDYLQSNHLICRIPPYRDTSIADEVEVRVNVVSCGKVSDPHTFTYVPLPRKKGITKGSCQLLQLPKGVSPSAVKLNQLYAESGTNFSAKECLLVSNALTAQPTVSTGESKDRAVIHSVQVSRVLATVTPQIYTTPTFVTRLPQRSSTTFTTANMLTPKPCPNSTPSLITSELKMAASEIQKTGNEKSEVKDRDAVLENLIQMLKLLKTLPGSLQSPIVDFVAEEIKKHFKGESSPLIKPEVACGSSVQQASLGSFSSMASRSCVASKKKNLNNEQEGIRFVTKPPDMETSCFSITSSGKRFPVSPQADGYAFVSGNETSSIEEQVVHMSVPVTSFPTVLGQETRLQSQCVAVDDSLGRTLSHATENVVYSAPSEDRSAVGHMNVKIKNGWLGSAMRQISSDKDFCKSDPSVNLNLRAPIALPKPGNNIQFAVNSGNRFIDNLKEEKPIYPEEEISISLMPVNTLDRNCLPIHRLPNSSSHLTPKQTNDPSVELASNLFENGLILPHPVGTTLSPLTEPSTHFQAKLEISHPNPQLKEVALQDSGYALEAETQSRSFDTNALQNEGCDPLLSQANAVSSVSIHTTPDEQAMTLHPSDSTSMIQCPSTTINSAVSSEASIAQLSENDLLNYINPNCFDNGW